MTLDSDANALLSRIASSEQDALCLLESLLRLSRTHMTQFVQACRDGHPQLRTDAERALVLRLDQADAKHTLILPAKVCRDIAVICDQLVSSAPAHQRNAYRCIVLRGLAEAVDRSHHARIRVAWTKRGVRELKPNELVPIFSPFHQPTFRKAYGSVGTQPHKLDRSVDTTEHAVLVPEQLPHALQLIAQPGWDGLDILSASSSIACALLTGDDLVIAEQDHGRARFFGAAPSDPQAALQHALRLVQRADQEQAHAVLMPELSLDSAGCDGVAQWVTTDAKHIGLAVCGTHHAQGDGPRRNEAVLASSISPTLRQSKVVGFEFKPTPGGRELREDIEAHGTRLHLITSQGWSALILICRDFIDADLSTLARKLRASLILVPACSPRTADFRAGAGNLASKAQAHVLVANKCDEGEEEPDCVLLARPSTQREHGQIHVPAKGVVLPRLATTSLHRGGWTLDD